ncbi:hypothetical protein FB107DRAFT_210343 [Schizophyllum commune]
MANQRVDDILRRARNCDTAPEAVLSAVLSEFFRQRLQPLDTNYVSESACRRLLEENQDILSLLLSSIHSGRSDELWGCDFLRFANVSLRSQSPQCPTDYRIDSYISDWKLAQLAYLSEYVNNTSELATWVPITDEADHDPGAYVDFISSLRIPTMPESHPSLLLHGLGTMLEPNTLSARLNRIFVPNQHTIFMNASDTGKTRLMLEGLCQRWGMYVSGNMSSPDMGSADICVGLTLARLHGQSDAEAVDGIPTSNCQVVHEVFERVLLARLTVFELFLKGLPNVHDRACRKRWLLLQVAPYRTIRRDIFEDLSTNLDTFGASPKYVRRCIEDTLLRIRSLLGSDEPIYCVIDDAHDLDEHAYGALGSSTTLREAARCWEDLDGLTLVLCGAPLDTSRFSVSSGYRICTDTGFFDQAEDHAAYVRQYLPPEVSQSLDGKKLLHRICIWLRGRYRPTTSFILCLLATRFFSPHTVLTAFIASCARVEPGDGPLRQNKEFRAACNGMVASLRRFDLKDVLGYDHLAVFYAHVVLHRILAFGHDIVNISENCSYLVSRAFAVFSNTNSTEAVVNEPMYIFPLANMLFQQDDPADGYLCTEAASHLETPPVHQALHLSLIMPLLCALKGEYVVGDLFEFAPPRPSWADQRCQLVRVMSSKGRLCVTPYSTPFPNAVHMDGCWATESSGWLEHAAPEPFCVSSGFSHSDLLFAVQLGDGSLLYITLKVLLKNAHIVVTPLEIDDALARMAPDRIFQVCGNRSANLDWLSSPEGTGVPQVLRSFATFPEETDVNTLRHDCMLQPVAAVNLRRLRDIARQIPYRSVLRQIHKEIIEPRKRLLVGDESLRVDTEG